MNMAWCWKEHMLCPFHAVLLHSDEYDHTSQERYKSGKYVPDELRKSNNINKTTFRSSLDIGNAWD